MLKREPMTRRELEAELGTSQQRISEILRAVGARVVGYQPPPKQGRPAPIYAIGEEQEVSREWVFGPVASVWAGLGSRA
jgi:hypothetical protein